MTHRFRTLPLLWWVVGLVASGGARVSAVPGRPPSLQPCTFDTAAATVIVPMIVSLDLPKAPSLSGMAREQARAYRDAVATKFEAPTRIGVATRPLILERNLGNASDSVSYSIGGPLLLPLNASGRLEGPAVVAASGSPAIDSALVAAVRRLDSSGSLVPLGDWRRDVVGPLQLAVIANARPQADAPILVSLEVRAYAAQQFVKPKRFAKPVYPREGQHQRESAAVDVRYIVPEGGQVDPRSVEVLRVEVATKRQTMVAAAEFVEAATEAIGKSRFEPARVRGCPVPSTVHQRISFRSAS